VQSAPAGVLHVVGNVGGVAPAALNPTV